MTPIALAGPVLIAAVDVGAVILLLVLLRMEK
jgi:hypothetical protein